MNAGPGYALLYYLDEDSSARLLELRQQLSAAGLFPDAAEAIRPHLTLAAYGRVDLEATVSVLKGAFRQRSPSPLHFEKLGSFPTTGVLHTSPAVTAELLALHADLHAALGPVTGDSYHYYRPGQWNPHCTLALGLSRAGLAEAYRLALDCWEPFTASLVELALIVPAPTPQILYTQPAGR